MNRRHFFSSVAKAVACFTVLPSATTYARKWVVREGGLVVPRSTFTYYSFAPFQNPVIRKLSYSAFATDLEAVQADMDRIIPPIAYWNCNEPTVRNLEVVSKQITAWGNA